MRAEESFQIKWNNRSLIRKYVKLFSKERVDSPHNKNTTRKTGSTVDSDYKYTLSFCFYFIPKVYGT